MSVPIVKIIDAAMVAVNAERRPKPTIATEVIAHANPSRKAETIGRRAKINGHRKAIGAAATVIGVIVGGVAISAVAKSVAYR